MYTEEGGGENEKLHPLNNEILTSGFRENRVEQGAVLLNLSLH